jgi:hypothetical protein
VHEQSQLAIELELRREREQRRLVPRQLSEVSSFDWRATRRELL